MCPLNEVHPEIWFFNQKEKQFPIQKLITAPFTKVLKSTPQVHKAGRRAEWATLREQGRNLGPLPQTREQTHDPHP